MKQNVRVEEFGMFLLSIFLFGQTEFVWWYFPLLLLIPDVSMIGYAVNNKMGAVVYNFFHHKALAILVYITGVMIDISYLELAGIILFGHTSMDRIFGYGFKHFDSFKHTHLGRIGKN